MILSPPQSGTAGTERSEPKPRRPSGHRMAAGGGGQGQGCCRLRSRRRQGHDEQNRQEEVDFMSHSTGTRIRVIGSQTQLKQVRPHSEQIYASAINNCNLF